MKTKCDNFPPLQVKCGTWDKKSIPKHILEKMQHNQQKGNPRLDNKAITNLYNK
jgi:hypothetical protein